MKNICGKFFLASIAVLFAAVGAAMPVGSGIAWAASSNLKAWNGLEVSEMADTPYISRSLKKKIDKLIDEEAKEDLPIPILFGVGKGDLDENFGDPRGGGRTHEGLDIMAPEGAPVVSPTEAVVLSVGTGASSGNTVSTANPGGETFVYMHLNSIADIGKGDELDPGDIIGYVGNTGNASGGPAHLHFEIRNGGASNPFARLEKEFSIADKIDFGAQILKKCDDRLELAKFLAKNYADEFALAQTQGLDIPEEIADSLENNSGSDARDDQPVISIGSAGTSVKTLQKYLISQNKGAAAEALAANGATGYFGQLTYDALVEYQDIKGLAVTGSYKIPEGGSANFLANLEKGTTTKSIASHNIGAKKALEIEILKAQIQLVQAQIAALQEQLLAMQAAG